MIVYHGSNCVVDRPDVYHSERMLDFGKGFYVTTVQEQALKWARRKSYSDVRVSVGIVNVYDFSGFDGLKLLDFKDDLNDWIDFVCACRRGSNIYNEYDVIMGKVADDKVFRVVELYRRGVWDKERAIKEFKVYDLYDQIAFVSQEAIESTLSFNHYFDVSL